MIREELEFRIALYADGDLPPDQRPALEAELAADGDARRLVGYQSLKRLLGEAIRAPMPAVRWDRLASHLSAAVAAGTREKSVVEEGGPDLSDPNDSAAAVGLDEQVEFAIACYADGTLAPDRRGEVERLFATDDRARELLDEYENVDATAKVASYVSPFPSVDWDRLAARLGTVAAAPAGAELPDAIERQIADYATGADPVEREAVEAHLDSEPAARIAFSEYRNLDKSLKSLALTSPSPRVDWDRLADRVSKAAAGAERERTGAAGPFPIRAWLRSPVRMAAAASVLVAAIVGARLLHRGPVKTPPGSQPTPTESVAVVTPLQSEAPAGTAIEEIQIGPPKAPQGSNGDGYADAGDEGDGVVSSPPHAFVASGASPVKDADLLPAMPY